MLDRTGGRAMAAGGASYDGVGDRADQQRIDAGGQVVVAAVLVGAQRLVST